MVRQGGQQHLNAFTRGSSLAWGRSGNSAFPWRHGRGSWSAPCLRPREGGAKCPPLFKSTVSLE
jgi:hypothetical protein